MSDCTVYIDEAGDLGFQRGTQWFVLSAVIVNKQDEPEIRSKLSQIRGRLNVNGIHLRKITDFYKRALIVRELATEVFTYVNIVADTSKMSREKIESAAVAYNYLCRLLLERVSWLLRDTNRVGDIVLSARGTNRDKELIEYIQNKLIPYQDNQLVGNTFDKILAKSAGSWELLQLADVCATTMFLAYEKNGWGFRTPCFAKVLGSHLYRYNGKAEKYGLKFFKDDMKPDKETIKCDWPCEKERTPGTNTTC